MRAARCEQGQCQPDVDPLANLGGFSSQRIAINSHLCDASRAAPCSQQLESSCASHVRTRTILLRPCSSSATIALDLHSAVLRAPDRSSVIPARCRRRPTRTSLCAVRAAADPPTMSRERHRLTACCTKLALLCGLPDGCASRGRISGEAKCDFRTVASLW
jgi:hypothetical protein